ncbi:MAG: DUF3822 family protein [Mucilaginibacter sp.]
MTEQTYTYNHNSFNLNEAGNYTLLIQANAKTFDYAITHNKTLMSLGTNCAVDELTSSDKLMAEYKQTVITVPAKAFTLVPVNLFDAARLADMARVLDVKENEKVLAQVLDEDNYVIYKSDEQLVRNTSSLDTKNIKFAPDGWLKAIEQSGPSNSYLHLNINGTYVEFAYFKGNKLRFYNKFEATSPEELLYFTLMVSNELELKQQQTTLVLSGSINPGDAHYKNLAEYFFNVRLNSQQPLELPADMDIPAHQLLYLSALYLCAL